MSGTLRRAAVDPHQCPSPPEIRTYEPGEGVPLQPGWTPPKIVDRIPNGSTFTCEECGRTMVVAERPTMQGRNVVVIGGPYWREETKRERRRRLRAERRACTCRRPGTLPPLHGGYRAVPPCPTHPRS